MCPRNNFKKRAEASVTPVTGANISAIVAETFTTLPKNRKRLFILDRISKTKFLIDTGSEVSVIPKQRNHTQATSNSLFAANGTPIQSFGNSLLNLDLGTRRNIEHNFVVASVNTPIIGADLLSDHDLMPNLRAGLLIDSVTQRHSKGSFPHSSEPISEHGTFRPIELDLTAASRNSLLLGAVVLFDHELMPNLRADPLPDSVIQRHIKGYSFHTSVPRIQFIEDSGFVYLLVKYKSLTLSISAIQVKHSAQHHFETFISLVEFRAQRLTPDKSLAKKERIKMLAKGISHPSSYPLAFGKESGHRTYVEQPFDSSQRYGMSIIYATSIFSDTVVKFLDHRNFKTIQVNIKFSKPHTSIQLQQFLFIRITHQRFTSHETQLSPFHKPLTLALVSNNGSSPRKDLHLDLNSQLTADTQNIGGNNDVVTSALSQFIVDTIDTTAWNVQRPIDEQKRHGEVKAMKLASNFNPMKIFPGYSTNRNTAEQHAASLNSRSFRVKPHHHYWDIVHLGPYNISINPLKSVKSFKRSHKPDISQLHGRPPDHHPTVLTILKPTKPPLLCNQKFFLSFQISFNLCLLLCPYLSKLTILVSLSLVGGCSSPQEQHTLWTLHSHPRAYKRHAVCHQTHLPSFAPLQLLATHAHSSCPSLLPVAPTIIHFRYTQFAWGKFCIFLCKLVLISSE